MFAEHAEANADKLEKEKNNDKAHGMSKHAHICFLSFQKAMTSGCRFVWTRPRKKKNRLDPERQSANSEQNRHTSSHQLVSEENRSKKKITTVQTDVRQSDRKGNVSEDGADGRMEGRVWKQRVCRGEFRCYRFPHFSGSGSCSTLPLSLCSCSPMENDSL